ncbi:hypothetical protein ACOI9X_03025 [Pseudomonas sp. P2757]|uniref:hypothetical protein n=1 Tax=unclassified Pseudomonas TaxID=196821 RepID=UPI003B592531
MLKIKKKIPNPMTIIAIFAVLSESSAAISLPFLADEEREIYVWFLISFPFYLLFLFFMTLNFNYRSLYAPSDFETDESFIQVIDSKERDNRKPGSTEQTPCEIADSALSDRTHNIADPPTNSQDTLDPMAQHHIKLPDAIRELHIIDARTMTEKNELGESLEKIPPTGKRISQVVIFLSNDVSDKFLTTDNLRESKLPKKGRGTSYFIVYKVCTRAVTALGKF